MTTPEPLHDKLLPCPFCGGEALLDEHEGRIASGHYTAQVACSTCENVNGECCYGISPEEASANAIAAWNTRPTPSPCSLEVRERVAKAISAAFYGEGLPDTRKEMLRLHIRVREAVLSSLSGDTPAEYCGFRIQHDPKLHPSLAVFHDGEGHASGAFVHGPADTITLKREDVEKVRGALKDAVHRLDLSLQGQHGAFVNSVREEDFPVFRGVIQILTTALEGKA